MTQMPKACLKMEINKISFMSLDDEIGRRRKKKEKWRKISTIGRKADRIDRVSVTVELIQERSRLDIPNADHVVQRSLERKQEERNVEVV